MIRQVGRQKEPRGVPASEFSLLGVASACSLGSAVRIGAIGSEDRRHASQNVTSWGDLFHGLVTRTYRGQNVRHVGFNLEAVECPSSRPQGCTA